MREIVPQIAPDEVRSASGRKPRSVPGPKVWRVDPSMPDMTNTRPPLLKGALTKTSRTPSSSQSYTSMA